MAIDKRLPVAVLFPCIAALTACGPDSPVLRHAQLASAVDFVSGVVAGWHSFMGTTDVVRGIVRVTGEHEQPSQGRVVAIEVEESLLGTAKKGQVVSGSLREDERCSARFFSDGSVTSESYNGRNCIVFLKGDWVVTFAVGPNAFAQGLFIVDMGSQGKLVDSLVCLLRADPKKLADQVGISDRRVSELVARLSSHRVVGVVSSESQVANLRKAAQSTFNDLYSFGVRGVPGLVFEMASLMQRPTLPLNSPQSRNPVWVGLPPHEGEMYQACVDGFDVLHGAAARLRLVSALRHYDARSSAARWNVIKTVCLSWLHETASR